MAAWSPLPEEVRRLVSVVSSPDRRDVHCQLLLANFADDLTTRQGDVFESNKHTVFMRQPTIRSLERDRYLLRDRAKARLGDPDFIVPGRSTTLATANEAPQIIVGNRGGCRETPPMNRRSHFAEKGWNCGGGRRCRSAGVKSARLC